MFREMRRGGQALPQAVCEDILAHSTHGVLAVLGDNEYPYAVPVSHAYQNGKLYFHCAKSGHKLDALRAHPLVSYCVVEQDVLVPEEHTTYYRSVVAFGRASAPEGEAKREALALIGRRFMPQLSEQALRESVDSGFDKTCVVEIAIENLTGKEGTELARRRREGKPAEETAAQKGN